LSASVLGYARVSTADQDVAGQSMRLVEAGAITDGRSGRNMDRPGLDALLAYAREGDTLAVVRLDRLGRSLGELLTTVAMLRSRGIALLSLEEKINTGSAAGELVFHVFGAIAHFERRLIAERTKDGIAAARARGKRPGRQPLGFQQFIREGRISDAHQLGRYGAHRRRAILAANVIDLETRLTDALLDMADKLIGSLFARARKAKERRYVASTRDVGRLMRLLHGTIEALETAQEAQRDGFAVMDERVGWAKLQRVRGDVRTLADLAEEDPLLGAADRYRTLRKFAPELIEALEFKAARSHDPTLSAIRLLQELNRSGKRDVPADAPMPFRKEWKRLVTAADQPNRRLYETAVFATLRDKLRSGDVWVERSASYRRFDSYLLPPTDVPAIAAKLGLPAMADEWLARRGAELDQRLKRLARRLRRGELEGVELRDGRLHVGSVKAATPPEAEALAERIGTLLPQARITEVMHEVSRASGGNARRTRAGHPAERRTAPLPCGGVCGRCRGGSRLVAPRARRARRRGVFHDHRRRRADRLTGASTPVAKHVELHETINDNGVMKMRPVDALAVRPDKPVLFAPGGCPVMLVGLNQPLKVGETFPLTLTFDPARSP